MPNETPLSDVRVIDATQVIAGPICGAYLADFGADVIKLESPSGDINRIGQNEKNGEPVSATFELVNRNKRSIAIDLKTEEGREIVYDLVADAEVFLQNWQPGVAERLGVDYETLETHNDDLVYVQVTGYGESGPAANQPAFDTSIQHISGLSSLMGYEGQPPVRAQSSLSDFYAGTNAAVATLAALRHSERGGGGQKVSISMLESLMHNMDGAFELYNNFDEEYSRGGDSIFSRPGGFPAAFETKDGYVNVSSFLHSDKLWGEFCDLVDRPDLFEEAAYDSPDNRSADADRFKAILQTWIGERTAEGALEGLSNAGIPVAPHNSVSEAAAMEHVKDRGVFEEIEHPRLDSFVLTTPPFRLSVTSPEIRSVAPALGEHTAEVLEEAGYSEDRIDALKDEAVIANGN